MGGIRYAMDADDGDVVDASGGWWKDGQVHAAYLEATRRDHDHDEEGPAGQGWRVSFVSIIAWHIGAC